MHSPTAPSLPRVGTTSPQVLGNDERGRPPQSESQHPSLRSRALVSALRYAPPPLFDHEDFRTPNQRLSYSLGEHDDLGLSSSSSASAHIPPSPSRNAFTHRTTAGSARLYHRTSTSEHSARRKDLMIIPVSSRRELSCAYTARPQCVTPRRTVATLLALWSISWHGGVLFVTRLVFSSLS